MTSLPAPRPPRTDNLDTVTSADTLHHRVLCLTQGLPLITRRRVITALLLLVFCILFTQWRAAITRNRSIPDAPFRIAGNLYSVGHTGVTSFLLVGPDGHVLIDGGFPEHGPLIVESIAQLGFDIEDVEILLNSHGHSDHAGSLQYLQEASGAEMWVSRGDSAVMANGGRGDKAMGGMRHAWHAGLLRFPAPRIDHVFSDGDTIRVGPIEVVAHVTPGHTQGCTSWGIRLVDEGREFEAVSICSLTLFPFVSLESDSYPELPDDFEETFRKLRSLEPDIFLGSHSAWFRMHTKNRMRSEGGDSVAPFIDPEGYEAFIAGAERVYLERRQPR